MIDGLKNNVIETIEVPQAYEMTIDSSRNKVYVTFVGTGILSIIDEPSKQIQNSSISFQVLIGIIIIIAIASIASAFFIRKNKYIKSKNDSNL